MAFVDKVTSKEQVTPGICMKRLSGLHKHTHTWAKSCFLSLKPHPSSNLNVSDSDRLLCTYTFEVKDKSYVLLITSSVSQVSLTDNRNLSSCLGAEKDLVYRPKCLWNFWKGQKGRSRLRVQEQAPGKTHKDWSTMETASSATFRMLGIRKSLRHFSRV